MQVYYVLRDARLVKVKHCCEVTTWNTSSYINHFIIKLMHNVKYVELIKTY